MAVDERRARLGVRHHLAARARAATVTEVARDLVALHATDPASVFLAAWARMREPDLEAVEHALYDERSLLRMLGMRRTMFAVPTELVPVIDAACGRAVAARERRVLVKLLEETGTVGAGGADAWLRHAADAVINTLAARGEARGAELSEAVPELRAQFSYGEGKKWAGTQGLSTRVLFWLGAEGRIARGRPRGSWISSQYRWALLESWLSAPLVELAVADAQAELARRWLAAFGPAAAADLKCWSGWTLAEVKRALTAIGPVEVDLDGTTGIVLHDDLEPVRPPKPWAALLPALDPTVMGWSHREWFLGEHRTALFDRSGNAGPTVWWDGRIVGGWAQRRSGEVVYRLLEDVGSAAAATVEATADRLGTFLVGLGTTRVTPRFRTPLERELTA